MNVEQHQQSLAQPPPPSQCNTEPFVNYSVSNANALPTAGTTTYVTIGLLPPSTQQTCLTSTSSSASSGTTSTFKTTLLPMPSIEDIESTTHVYQGKPGGILKYPSNSTKPMSLPLGLGPGPPLSMVEQLPPAYPINLPMDACTTVSTLSTTTLPVSEATSCGTFSSNTELMASSAIPTSQNIKCIMNSKPSTVAETTNINNFNNVGSSNSLRNKCLSTTVNIGSSSKGSKQSKPIAKKSCCACFGNSTSSAPATTSKSKSKNFAQNHQTIWSAMLTNLGICALLLAYTLLGSFIFLTIEGEDSLHHQHTLASTKRVAAMSGRGTLGNSGAGVTNINSNIAGNSVYNTQQKHQTNILSNNTMISSSTSSSDSGSPMDGNSNDIIYGDDAVPLYAFAPDTFEVRQRTIENIWDITVSLNILYKENWTKLAALEIAKFQDQLVKRLNEDGILQLSQDADGLREGNSPATEAVLLHTRYHHLQQEWNFAKAFLYSLTVLTTVGYGNVAPRTTLGRIVTMAYAFFGIPLTLIYLSSTGGILAKVAREVFSKALCCCLCSNCGYCCYDEKRMAEKERRMKRKRQHEELRKQHSAMQEPYYVRSSELHDSYLQAPEKAMNSLPLGPISDIDSLSASESRGSMHGLSILAPILLCFSMMIIYILFGALMLYRLENWPILDGIYFCFMSLSTIGFGDMLPILRRDTTTTTWFISIYIMSGMALTAMCFNVIHEEIVNRIKIVVEFKKDSIIDSSTNNDCGYFAPS